ncbi:MAG: HNH endonuclease, partial [Chloroflexota bacterium]|nr:HNH endonuclease [Chloroflexota bacterium]
TEVQGQTACGRATVIALQLNNPIARLVRSAWVTAGWHPPVE